MQIFFFFLNQTGLISDFLLPNRFGFFVVVVSLFFFQPFVYFLSLACTVARKVWNLARNLRKHKEKSSHRLKKKDLYSVVFMLGVSTVGAGVYVSRAESGQKKEGVGFSGAGVTGVYDPACVGI